MFYCRITTTNLISHPPHTHLFPTPAITSPTASNTSSLDEYPFYPLNGTIGTRNQIFPTPTSHVCWATSPTSPTPSPGPKWGSPSPTSVIPPKKSPTSTVRSAAETSSGEAKKRPGLAKNKGGVRMAGHPSGRGGSICPASSTDHGSPRTHRQQHLGYPSPKATRVTAGSKFRTNWWST